MFGKFPDWLFYAVILTIIIFYVRKGSGSDYDTPPPPVLGPALPNATPLDPNVIVKVDRPASGVGTAFTVDGKGTWLTAKHVVDSCDKVGLLLSSNRFVEVKVQMISKFSDTALLNSTWNRPALPQDLNTTRTIGEHGFFVGFPQGRPGEAAGSLLGRRRMVVRGRYRSSEQILAWSEIGRTRGLSGSLGGLSGGPVFDSDGEVIGLVTAESTRRGRIYTVAPATLRGLLAPAEKIDTAKPINVRTYGRAADALRRTRQVAQVYCIVE